MAIESGSAYYTTISTLIVIALFSLSYYLGTMDIVRMPNKLLYFLILVGLIALLMYQRLMYVGLGEVFNDWFPNSNIARRMKCEDEREELEEEKKKLEGEVTEGQSKLEQINQKLAAREKQETNEAMNNKRDEMMRRDGNNGMSPVAMA